MAKDAITPGTMVKIIDGTFVDSVGEGLSCKNAVALWQQSGGQEPEWPRPGLLYVAISIFGRRVPVCLERWQAVITP